MLMLVGGFRGIGGLVVVGDEAQRRRVDAEALSAGTGAVVEDVAEMDARLGVEDLGTHHAMADVTAQDDVAVVDRLRERGPSCARVELVIRSEQGKPTHGGHVRALAVLIPVLSREGSFCATSLLAPVSLRPLPPPHPLPSSPISPHTHSPHAPVPALKHTTFDSLSRPSASFSTSARDSGVTSYPASDTFFVPTPSPSAICASDPTKNCATPPTGRAASSAAPRVDADAAITAITPLHHHTGRRAPATRASIVVVPGRP